MSEITADASTDIAASPQEVWTALTSPDLIRRYYMGATVITDWKVGSRIEFRGSWNGQTYEDHGHILSFDPPERLTYSHWSPMSGTEDLPENHHVVDIRLRPERGHTHVDLAQSNMTGEVTDADVASRPEFERNWLSVLDGLRQTVESISSTATSS